MTTSRDQPAFSPNVSPVCTSDFTVTHEATKGENRQSGGKERRDMVEKKKEKRHSTEERSSLVIVKRDAQVDAG